MADLRSVQAQRVTLTQPNLAGLRTSFAAVQTAQNAANVAIAARKDQGRDQLKQLKSRTDALQYEVPNFANVNVQHGSRLESIYKNVMVMGRSLNSALQDASTTIYGVGSLERNKESGLLKESNSILDEMQQTLNSTPIPTDQIAILPSYPAMFNELRFADSDMIRSVDAARASLTTLDQGLGDVDNFFRELNRTSLSYRGDISQASYDALAPLMQKAMTGLDLAATQASQAAQLYNMARTRQLSTRITLLGVGTSPERYATLQYALQQRFGMNGIPYQEMLHDGITPGDVVVATILAADIKSTPEDIIDQMISEKKSPVELADEHGMHAWPLEIFTGLVYLDYTDDPAKEMVT